MICIIVFSHSPKSDFRNSTETLQPLTAVNTGTSRALLIYARFPLISCHLKTTVLKTVLTTVLITTVLKTVLTRRVTTSSVARCINLALVNCFNLVAGPSGVTAPRVGVLSPTSLFVAWSPPSNPNGIMQSYIVQLPLPRYTIYNISQLSLTVIQLSAYTTYNVTLTACSGL